MVPFDGRLEKNLLYARATALLTGARDREDLARMMAELADLAGGLADGGTAPAMACRAGCPHCCVLNVTVLLPEAAAIAGRLAEVLAGSAVNDLAVRLDDQRRRVRWMDDGERVRKQIFCPFLDETASCAIHLFRPLVCRGVTSTDSILCRGALDPTELDVPRAVPMDLALKAAMDGAFCALGNAMASCGLDERGIELTAGVSAFLADPGLTDLLLAGCRLPDRLWE